MILSTISQSIAIVLGGAITTNQLAWTAAFVDHTATSFVPDSSNGLTNGTTPVTMVAAPAASTSRQVKYLSVSNTDTVNATVTINFIDGANTRRLTTVVLAPGEGLEWTPDSGFQKPYQQQVVTGPVASVFGRTGTVVAQAGDYTGTQVTFTPVGGISSTNVQAAIAEVDSEKQPLNANLTAYAGGDTPSAFTLGIVDSANAGAWRTALGLGGAAVLNVGATAGTVAAGDDTRIVNAFQTTGGTISGATTINASLDVNAPITSTTTGTPLTLSRFGTGSQNIFILRAARGSVGSPAILNSGDAAVFLIQGYDGSTYRNMTAVTALLIEPTPSTSAFGCAVRFQVPPVGAVSTNEVMRVDHASGLQLMGTNIVIDQNRNHRLRTFTVATLPASPVSGTLAQVSDSNTTTFNAVVAGGGANVMMVRYNGTNWVIT